MKKRVGALALVVAASAAATGLVASTSSGAPRAQRTIGLVLPGPNPTTRYLDDGAESAAARLGDHLAITLADGLRTTSVGAIKSLIAQHAAAIAVGQGAQIPDEQVLSALAEARRAGIQVLSFEGRVSGSLWVSDSGSAQFVRALADALAAQMKQRGQFVIVSCRARTTAALSPAVLGAWVKQTTEYVQRRYPRMQRVGIVYGPSSGSLQLGPVLTSHPHVRGLDFLCPNDALNDPPQLVRAHKVGKVFSAGNGGACPPFDLSGDQNSTYQNSVRHGALEVVCLRNPSKLAYLTVWAADYLARGHTLTARRYAVGGPVGTVAFDRRHDELRLGQPLTITKTNVDRYAPGSVKGHPRHLPAEEK